MLGFPAVSISEVGVRLRPLGLTPLLDSPPLPATRPGILRPRRPEVAGDEPSAPQRAVFGSGPGEPAEFA